jgi:hypothetical protein
LANFLVWTCKCHGCWDEILYLRKFSLSTPWKSDELNKPV